MGIISDVVEHCQRPSTNAIIAAISGGTHGSHRGADCPSFSRQCVRRQLLGAACCHYVNPSRARSPTPSERSDARAMSDERRRELQHRAMRQKEAANEGNEVHQGCTNAVAHWPPPISVRRRAPSGNGSCGLSPRRFCQPAHCPPRRPACSPLGCPPRPPPLRRMHATAAAATAPTAAEAPTATATARGRP